MHGTGRHIEGRRHKDRFRASQSHAAEHLRKADVEADRQAERMAGRTEHRDRVAGALRSTGEETLRELASEGQPALITCQFCGRQYSFLPEDLLDLVDSSGENTERS